MPKRTRKYEDSLEKSLKNPVEAAAYLNAHLEKDDDDSEELFLLALRDVAKAYGISEIAQNTGLGRESLYKALSVDGNPRLTTLKDLLDSMGLRPSVEMKEIKAS
ncbi:MAG: putative addiction module antidote protein [Bdellovibrionales bacterium GWA2_49_15]|nr:MAG: putative addiction module antidote protein [Bdellovibrionales bacterium GWA2_49_15]HAZ12487.1 putative addiction module antidote protein [Bdellovibrionales bacterium]